MKTALAVVADRAFQPGSYEVSSLRLVSSFAVSLAAAAAAAAAAAGGWAAATLGGFGAVGTIIGGRRATPRG
jgi:hypothetical protein